MIWKLLLPKDVIDGKRDELRTANREELCLAMGRAICVVLSHLTRP